MIPILDPPELNAGNRYIEFAPNGVWSVQGTQGTIIWELNGVTAIFSWNGRITVSGRGQLYNDIHRNWVVLP